MSVGTDMGREGKLYWMLRICVPKENKGKTIINTPLNLFPHLSSPCWTLLRSGPGFEVRPDEAELAALSIRSIQADKPRIPFLPVADGLELLRGNKLG